MSSFSTIVLRTSPGFELLLAHMDAHSYTVNLLETNASLMKEQAKQYINNQQFKRLSLNYYFYHYRNNLSL